MKGAIGRRWTRFFMRFAGTGWLGRLATRLAILSAPPFYERRRLAWMNSLGYVAPSAVLHGDDLRLGPHVFLDDRVLLYQEEGGGRIELGEYTQLMRDTVVQVGKGGSVSIGSRTCIQPRCQLSGYASDIVIGERVQIAPNCAFYPYDHGVAPDRPIWDQDLTSKGPILVGDDAWLGYGAVLLSGVTIGTGSVVGAGAVVTGDVPDGAIAVGSPARVIAHREDFRGAAAAEVAEKVAGEA